MKRIFGFDIGTTSIGFAVIDHDSGMEAGNILRLGVRIFPEARDPDGTPLNQQRRLKRMVRRQLRRRRARRRLLNETLNAAGLLPEYGSDEWQCVMRTDPYDLRKRGLLEALTPHEVGRSLYHLAQRRHFKGRDIAEADDKSVEDADEKAAKTNRESTLQSLKADGATLGAWLADKKADARTGIPPRERRRGFHADRSVVSDEFKKLWAAQAEHHKVLDDAFKVMVEDVIFAQRPVFWRKNTLGECRFMPGEDLCPRGAWLSQQRRMLEKLNNLALVGGNARFMDDEERAAILERLQTQVSMTWGGVRTALKPIFKARGEAGAEKRLKFNLELGGDKKLLGNAVEAKLAKVFGEDWTDHPHKQPIRDAVPQHLWSADYGEIGDQRVVIRAERDRRERRAKAAQGFIDDFGVTSDQARALQELNFPPGWEPYSTLALEAFLPHLEAGVRFGALVSDPDWEDWRNETFPARERPTGEFLDRLPSPAVKAEREHIAKLRNPTVVRARNELRKVVNNLIDMYGKPDLIRVEVARAVGHSKRDREEISSVIRKNNRRRTAAIEDLESKGIAEPSRDTVEKWLLWDECNHFCPYTGDPIGWDDLFGAAPVFDVEHIWPRGKSFDNSYKNKTLCRRDKNIEKGNHTPFEAFGQDPAWPEMVDRVWALVKTRKMRKGKAKRFCSDLELTSDFTSRQLIDTGYAARQAVASLKRLWPDVGPKAPVNVETVSGLVTAQLRRLWTLNNILADDGEKTRADHRHHAVDALTVACTDPGITHRLSRYWQAKDDPSAERPNLPAPWPTIRADAERAVADIVVSHRVRRKVSGPLHKDTIYGDTGEDVTTKSGIFREFVTRKKVEVLTKGELERIRDRRVRETLTDWVAAHGGDPKKAFPPYPRLGHNGPEIRKVRLIKKQQLDLMGPVSTGYADLGSNHHIAIYRKPDGAAVFEVVSLFEAARRLSRREPVVRRQRDDGADFVMSLGSGDTVEFPSGSEKGLWIVQGVSSAGRPTLSRLNDARPTTRKEAEKKGMDGPRKDFEPRFGGFMARSAKKISIDPIGRIRKAND